MTDYAELLATKSAELAELTRAFNDKDYSRAFSIAYKLKWDMAQLCFFADARGDLRILRNDGL